jgi:Cytochrome c, mono- and diheme variants
MRPGAVLAQACQPANPYRQGEILYEVHCANCHQPGGGGLIGNIPPLAGSDWLVQQRSEIACIIRYGMQGPIEVNGLPYQGIMPGNKTLSDTEITNITNYILKAWGNELPSVNPQTVSQELKACEDRPYIGLDAFNPLPLEGGAQ